MQNKSVRSRAIRCLPEPRESVFQRRAYANEPTPSIGSPLCPRGQLSAIIIGRQIGGNLPKILATTAETLLNTTVYYDSTVNGPIGAGESRARSTSYRLPDGPRGVGDMQVTVTAEAPLVESAPARHAASGPERAA